MRFKPELDAAIRRVGFDPEDPLIGSEDGRIMASSVQGKPAFYQWLCRMSEKELEQALLNPNHTKET